MKLSSAALLTCSCTCGATSWTECDSPRSGWRLSPSPHPAVSAQTPGHRFSAKGRPSPCEREPLTKREHAVKIQMQKSDMADTGLPFTQQITSDRIWYNLVRTIAAYINQMKKRLKRENKYQANPRWGVLTWWVQPAAPPNWFWYGKGRRARQLFVDQSSVCPVWAAVDCRSSPGRPSGPQPDHLQTCTQAQKPPITKIIQSVLHFSRICFKVPKISPRLSLWGEKGRLIPAEL